MDVNASEPLNPYAPPEGEFSEAPQVEVHAYMARFLPFWSTMAGCAVVIDLLITVMDRHQVHPVKLFLAMFLPTIALQAMAAMLFVWYFRIYISSVGIRCTDFWGRYRSLAWPHICQVEPSRVLGLAYLKLYSPLEPRPLWLPLFLKRSDQFWRQVLTWLPDDSPLLSEARRRCEPLPPTAAGQSPAGEAGEPR